MEDNVKKQLDQLGNIIDEKIEKANGQVLENANGKIDSVLKGEITNLTQKFNERMDEMEVNQKKNFDSLVSQKEDKSFKGGLIKSISEGALDSFRNGNNSVKFDVKADMTMNADFSGEVVPADRVPGYKFDPTRSVHIRNLIPLGS